MKLANRPPRTTRPSFTTSSLAGWALLAVALFAQVSVRPATLSVSPAVVTNDYAGKITLAVTGVPAGAGLRVEKYIDLDDNGRIDATDLLLQGFVVADGMLPLIGGVRNINQPGDEDAAANGQARIEVLMPGVEPISGTAVGRFLYRVSGVAGGFDPVTGSFEVKQKVRAQGVKGKVTDAKTGAPLRSAVALVRPYNNQGTIVFADAAGDFTLYGEPGAYLLVPSLKGYVYRMDSGEIDLSANQVTRQDLTLTLGALSVSGRVYDRGSNLGIAGVLISAESDDGWFSFGFTDGAGLMDTQLLPGHWELGLDRNSLASQGYVGYDEPFETNLVSSVIGMDVPVYKADALIYGTVKDEAGQPVPGLTIRAKEEAGIFEPRGMSQAANGDYALGVLGGMKWRVSIEDDVIQPAGYLSPEVEVAITSGQAVRTNLVVRRLTAAVSGHVRSSAGQPIPDLYVWADANIGGVYYSTGTYTGADGSYRLGLAPGTWAMGVDCFDDEGLFSRGYGCPENLAIVVTGLNHVADFTTPALEPGETDLAPGIVGRSYSCQMEAVGGRRPYTWELALGSAPLPDGLSLAPTGPLAGQVLGVPTTAGHYEFVVRITDAEGSSIEVTYALDISPAPETLEIVTDSPLPPISTGAAYDLQLEAAGGQPPYGWSRKPGSANLPAGLAITADGRITGVPTSSGSYFFITRVTDSSTPALVADKTFELRVYQAPLGFPIAAGLGNQFFWGLATDGTNCLVSYTDSAQASNVIGQILSPSGTLIEPLIRIDRVGGVSQPAFGRNVYLMVWEDRTAGAGMDIYAQLVRPNGTLQGSPFAVCTAGGDQRLDSRKSLTFDGTNFLVVWRDSRSGTANSDIYGQLIAPDGTLVGGEKLITAQPAFQGNLGAAFDGTRTLVVWMSQKAAGEQAFEVWGAFVTQTGAVIPPFRISQTSTSRAYMVRVGWNGSAYLVAWMRDTAPSASEPAAWDLAGRMIAPDGSLIGGEFQVGPAPGQQIAVSVTAMGSVFLVHWLDDFGGPNQVQLGQIYDSFGHPIGHPFLIAPAVEDRVPLGTVLPAGSGLLTVFTYAHWQYDDDLRAPLFGADIYGRLIARPPYLRLPEPLAGGAVRIQFEGGQLVDHVLEASSNLLNWTSLLTTNNVTGTVTYTDQAAAGLPARFYRVRLAQ